MPPEDVMEERLHDLEKTVGVLSGDYRWMTAQLENLIKSTDDVKDQINKVLDRMPAASQFNTIETAVVNAHKRLDEMQQGFGKLQTEHNDCSICKSGVWTETQIRISGIEGKVKELGESKEAVTHFISGRVGAIIDKLLWPALIFLALYVQSGYKQSPITITVTPEAVKEMKSGHNSVEVPQKPPEGPRMVP